MIPVSLSAASRIPFKPVYKEHWREPEDVPILHILLLLRYSNDMHRKLNGEMKLTFIESNLLYIYRYHFRQVWLITFIGDTMYGPSDLFRNILVTLADFGYSV
jgi:hypothetical protein